MENVLFVVSQPYAVDIILPVEQVLLARGGYKTAWFFLKREVALPDTSGQVLTDVPSVLEWQPSIVFGCGSVMPHFFPGFKVQIFHGFNAGKPKHLYDRGLYDLYCTVNDADTAAFERIRENKKHFQVVHTGWPKLDTWFQSKITPPDHKRNDGKPVILYHSTHSPSYSAARILHSTLKRLSRDGNWQFWVSLHPLTKPEVVASYRELENENLTFCQVSNIHTLFAGADLLISDNSSVIDEFLLLTRKPVITYKNVQPGPHLLNIDSPEKLEESITQALDPAASLVTDIKTHADNLHLYRDGQSSQRVLEAIEQAIPRKASLKPKPFNFFRKLRICKQLGFYKL